MRSLVGMLAVVSLFSSAPAGATDVMNRDRKTYRIKVQGEGKLSISYHTIRGGGTMYGLCGYSFCTFQIGRSKVSATRNDRLVIQNGRFGR